jgi:hypothetical protein
MSVEVDVPARATVAVRTRAASPPAANPKPYRTAKAGGVVACLNVCRSVGPRRVAPTRRPCMRQRLEGRRIWAAAGAAQQEPLLLRLLHEQLLRREDLHACRCLPCSRSAAASHQRWMPQCACGAERAADRQTGARDGRTNRRVDLRRGLVVEPVAMTGGRCTARRLSRHGRRDATRAGRLQLAARLWPDRSGQRQCNPCRRRGGCHPDGPVEVLAKRVSAVVSVVHAVGVEHRDDLQSRLVVEQCRRSKSRQHKECNVARARLGAANGEASRRIAERIAVRRSRDAKKRCDFAQRLGKVSCSPSADVAGVSPVPVPMWQG